MEAKYAQAPEDHHATPIGRYGRKIIISAIGGTIPIEVTIGSLQKANRSELHFGRAVHVHGSEFRPQNDSKFS
jgi:hypothetical protein